MPHQVDDALLHAMSGIELSRVRTELRLLPPEAYQPMPTRVEGPTLLCNQVVFRPVTNSHGPLLAGSFPGLRDWTGLDTS